jgi:predicted nucleotidyltransferase
MTPATEQKRAQLRQYIESVLEPDKAVQGVVAIGSVATGQAHAQSDIDLILFLHPFDYYVAPAEAIWQPADDSYQPVLLKDTVEGVALEVTRLDWNKWREERFVWPEPRLAELSEGWIAYDRGGEVTAVIQQRTHYPDQLRLERIDEAIIWLEKLLDPAALDTIWQTWPPTLAHHRLQAAYERLIQALFAFNRRWRPWYSREMASLLTLPWLPDRFAERVLPAANVPGLDRAGFEQRTATLRHLFTELLAQLTAVGDYSATPVDQAFLRHYDEPGHAWNLHEWVKYHTVRKLSRR